MFCSLESEPVRFAVFLVPMEGSTVSSRIAGLGLEAAPEDQSRFLSRVTMHGGPTSMLDVEVPESNDPVLIHQVLISPGLADDNTLEFFDGTLSLIHP
jgi:hypothetical protein